MPLLIAALLASNPATVPIRSEGGRPWFGHVAATAGDANGDGVHDWIVGFSDARAVRVISGKDATPLLTLNVPFGVDWMADQVVSLADSDGDGRPEYLASAGNLSAGTIRVMRGKDASVVFEVPGSCAAVLGDLNADGVADFVAAGAMEPGRKRPSVVVIELHSGKDGSLLAKAERALDKTDPAFALSPAGDVNRDGTPDFGMIGGSEALVLSGKDCGTLHVFREQKGRKPATIVGGADFDGDERSDLLVGYPNEMDEDEGKGFVVVHAGADGRELGTVEGTGGNFGFAMCLVGDVDGDAVPDFLVGSHGESFTDPLRMFSGRERKLLWKINADFDDDCHRIPVLAAVPDSDGDGATDLLVGCAELAGRCNKPGYVMVVSSKTGKSMRRIVLETAMADKAPAKPR